MAENTTPYNSYRKNLYDGLSKAYQLPSYEEFDKAMDNPASRQDIFNTYKDDLGDIADYSEFDSLMAPRVSDDNKQRFIQTEAAKWQADEAQQPQQAAPQAGPTPFLPNKGSNDSLTRQELNGRREYGDSSPLVDAKDTIQAAQQQQTAAAQQQEQYEAARIQALRDEKTNLEVANPATATALFGVKAAINQFAQDKKESSRQKAIALIQKNRELIDYYDQVNQQLGENAFSVGDDPGTISEATTPKEEGTSITHKAGVLGHMLTGMSPAEAEAKMREDDAARAAAMAAKMIGGGKTYQEAQKEAKGITPLQHAVEAPKSVASGIGTAIGGGIQGIGLAINVGKRIAGANPGNADQDAVYKWGTALNKWAEETFPRDERAQQSALQDIFIGLGSSAPYLAISLATGGVGGAVEGVAGKIIEGSGRAINLGLGMAQGASGNYEDAKQRGATEDQAIGSTASGALLGTLDALTETKVAERMMEKAIKGSSAWHALIREGISEGWTEGAQGLGTSLQGKYSGYNKDDAEQIASDALYQTVIGALSGVLMSGGGSAANIGANKHIERKIRNRITESILEQFPDAKESQVNKIVDETVTRFNAMQEFRSMKPEELIEGIKEKDAHFFDGATQKPEDFTKGQLKEMFDAVHGVPTQDAHNQSVRDGMMNAGDQGAALPAGIAEATADLPPLDAATGEPAAQVEKQGGAGKDKYDDGSTPEPAKQAEEAPQDEQKQAPNAAQDAEKAQPDQEQGETPKTQDNAIPAKSESEPQQIVEGGEAIYDNGNGPERVKVVAISDHTATIDYGNNDFEMVELDELAPVHENAAEAKLEDQKKEREGKFTPLSETGLDEYTTKDAQEEEKPADQQAAAPAKNADDELDAALSDFMGDEKPVDQKPGKAIDLLNEDKKAPAEDTNVKPWQKTKAEFIGNRTADSDVLLKVHATRVEEAVANGRPVPKNVLEEYKEYAWAKHALDKLNKENAAITTEKPAEAAASQIVEMPLSNIGTDEARFQGRDKLDQARIENYKENFDRRKVQNDPIKVWRDPADGQYKVLSGHHRFALFQQMGEKTIPAIVVQGDEAYAKDYAKHSNDSKPETPHEKAKLYREMRAAGTDEKEIKRQAKAAEHNNAPLVLALSHLNPTGKAHENLVALGGTESGSNARAAMDMAEWVGKARMQFPELTSAHENEIYDFLRDKYKKKINTQTELLEAVRRQIDRNSFMGTFAVDQPLNFNDHTGKSETEAEYDERIHGLEVELAAANKTLADKRKYFLENNATQEQLANGLKKYEDNIQAIQRELIQLKENRAGVLANIRGQEISLFDNLESKPDENQLSGAERRTQDEVAKSEPIIQALEAEGEAAIQNQGAESLAAAESALEKVDQQLEEIAAKKDVAPTEKKKPSRKKAIDLLNEQQETAPKPTKIQQKISEIDAALDAALDDFMKPSDKLMSSVVPVDPEKLAQGMKVIALYMQKGMYKFADILNHVYSKYGERLRPMLPAFKNAYMSYMSDAPDDILEKMDDVRTVRAFEFKPEITDNSETNHEEAKNDGGRTNEDGRGEPGNDHSEVSGNIPADGGGVGESIGSDRQSDVDGNGGVVSSEQSDRGVGDEGEWRTPGIRDAESEVGNGIPVSTSPGRDGVEPGRGNGDGGDASGLGGRTDGRGTRSRGSNNKLGQVDNGHSTRNLDEADRNHVITDADEIGKPRIASNIDAIELLQKLESEDRNPTPAEKRVLASYVGWGGFPQVFDDSKAARFERGDKDTSVQNWGKQYYKQYQKVKSLLTPEEREAAVKSTLNAHYTDPAVIKAMWRMAEHLGFDGGTVLEPAMGIGHFFGLMPQGLADKTTLLGVELDSISGRISKKLYPQAHIQNIGIENARFGQFTEGNPHVAFSDLVITNVPFAAEGEYFNTKDAQSYGSLNPDINNLSLHNQFIVRGLDALRPGGIQIVITSMGTMDAAGTHAREEMARRADLVAAIRLPNTSFEKNAKTAVTTDMLIFRKKDGRPNPEAPPFRYTSLLKTVKNLDGKDIEVWVNEYFAKNPFMMLGDMGIAKMIDEEGNSTNAGGLYGGQVQTLHARRGLDLEKAIQDITDNVLPANIAGEGRVVSEVKQKAEAGQKEGSFVIKEGVIHQVINGTLDSNPDFMYAYDNDKQIFLDRNGDPTDNKKKAALHKEIEDRKKRIEMFIPLRESIKKLRDLEVSKDATDEEIEAERANLNKLYDNYMKETGAPFNNRKNNFLDDDPESPLVFGLEKENDRHKVVNGKNKTEKFYTKMPIFTERQGHPFTEPETAKNVEDAVLISLAYRGSIHGEYISKLLGKPVEEVENDIIDSGLGFRDPVSGLLESRADYLSGFVRKKLREAKVVAESDPSYKKNVEALEEVVPKDIPLTDIRFQLGTSWIPEQHIADFIKNHLGVDVKVQHLQYGNSFTIEIKDAESANDARNTHTFGVFREETGAKLTALQIIEDALNSKAPKATYKAKDENGNEKTYVDDKATAIAQQRAEALNDAFVTYLNADPEHASVLQNTFNDLLNGIALKQYHLPAWEKYPGATVALRDYQKRVTSRALTEPTLIAHFAGAGKTFEAATITMEARRLGIARKPMIVVQNSTLRQFAAQYQQLYPNAKILCPSDNQRSARQRKKTISRIVTGDYDAVIIPKSFFGLIQDDPVRVNQAMMAEVGKMREALIRLAMEDGLDQDKIKAVLDGEKGVRGVPQRVKDIQRKINALLKRMKELADKTVDKTMTFEQLGIDYLIIDEAHDYKKLGFTTKHSGIKGIDTQGNPTSFSLKMKVDHIMEKTGNKNVVLMTGTPITNTLAEAWTYLRYLRPDILHEMGLEDFDSFANNFGDISQAFEYSMVGTHELVERFRGVNNGPEIIAAFRSMADVILDSDVKLDNMPEMQDGKPTKQKLKQTIGLRRMIEGFRQTINEFRNMSGIDKKIHSHIPITIFTEAKKAAIDLRLVDQNAPDYADSKTNVSVRNIYDIWKNKGAKYYDPSMNATQLVFCDLRRSREPFELGQKVRIAQPKIAEELAEYINPTPDQTDDNGPVDEFGRQIEKPMQGAQPKGKKKAVKRDYREAEILKLFRGTIVTQSGHEVEKDMAEVRYLDGEKETSVQVIDPDTFKLAKGVPSKAFDLYKDMQAKLIKMGVPESEILIIDQQTDKQKEKLFNQVKAGAIRIVFGHTEKLGIGVNVQDRLVAIHHLDAPSMPYLLEQRIKRMIRSGNLFGMPKYKKRVHNVMYGVEKSLDATAFQMLLNKQRGTDQILSGKLTSRHGEDTAGELQLSVQEIQEGLTGDPRVPQKNALEKKVEALQRRKDDADAAAQRARIEIHKITNYQIPHETKQLSFYESAIKEMNDVFPEGAIRTVEYDGKTVSEEVTEAQKAQAREEVRAENQELEKANPEKFEKKVQDAVKEFEKKNKTTATEEQLAAIREEVKAANHALEIASPEKFEKKVEIAIKAIEVKNRAAVRAALDDVLKTAYKNTIADYLASDKYPSPKTRSIDYKGEASFNVNGKEVLLDVYIKGSQESGMHTIKVPSQMKSLEKQGLERAYNYRIAAVEDDSDDLSSLRATIMPDYSYGESQGHKRSLVYGDVVSGNSFATLIRNNADKLTERKEGTARDLEAAKKEAEQLQDSVKSKWTPEEEANLEANKNELYALEDALAAGRVDRDMWESTWDMVKADVAPLTPQEEVQEFALWKEDVRKAAAGGRFTEALAHEQLKMSDVKAILDEAGLSSMIPEIKAKAEQSLTITLRSKNKANYEAITKKFPELVETVREFPNATDEELADLLQTKLLSMERYGASDIKDILESQKFGKGLKAIQNIREAIDRFDKEGYDPNATVRLSKTLNDALTSARQRKPVTMKDVLNRVGSGRTVQETLFPEQTGMRVVDAQQRANELLQGMTNAPRVKVVQNIMDLPAGLRRTINGGISEAVYWEKNNGSVKIYVIADQVKDADRLDAVLLHETVGHFGLRRTLGGSIDKVLDAVWNDYTNKIRSAEWYRNYADHRRYNPNTAEGKRALAEEYVAHEFAEKGNPDARLVDRIIRAVKQALRMFGVKLKLSDAELRSIVADSNKYVREGNGTDPNGGGPGGTRNLYAGENAQGFYQAKRAGLTFESPFDGKQRMEIDDSRAKLMQTEDGDLVDVLSHPKLYAAYPHLAGVKVEFQDMPMDEGGYFQRDSNLIAVNKNIPTDEEKLSVLMHEVQHAIQAVEGLNKGGGLKSLIKNGMSDADKAMLQTRVDNMKSWRRSAEVNGNWYSADPVAKRKFINQMNFMQGTIDQLKGGRDAEKAYQRIAGENEANDVQARLKYTVDERKNILPYSHIPQGSTEPLKPEDSIVAFDDEPIPYNVRFSKLQSTVPGNVYDIAKEETLWDKRGELGHKLQRMYQDHLLDLKKLQQAAEAKGRTILDEQNAYQKETLAYGKIETRLEDFEHNYSTPLQEAILEAKKKSGVTLDDVHYFLYATHAKERNAFIADQHRDIIDRLEQELPFETDPMKRDKIETRIKELRAGSGMSDESSAKILKDMDDAGKTPALEHIAQQVYDINRFDLDNRHKAGLLSDEHYQNLLHRYKFYVPLRGFEDEDRAQSIEPTGRGYDTRGKEYKAAQGRRSMADDIISYAIQQAEGGIIRSEKNNVQRALYNFMLAHPSSDLKPIKHYFVAEAEIGTGRPIYDSATGKQVFKIVTKRPPKMMFENGTARYQLDDNYHMVDNYDPKGLESDDVIGLKINGKAEYIKFANPELAKAMKKMNIEQASWFTTLSGRFVSSYRQMATQYNPEFAVSNFMRDLGEAVFYLNAEVGNGASAEVTKNIPAAMNGLRLQMKGDLRGEWAKAAHEFFTEGASTGFWNMKSIDARTKALVKAYDPSTYTSVKEKAKTALRFIDDVNRVVENGVRLSAYYHLTREKGWSRQKAAAYVKDMTINFNRHGEKGNVMSQLYVFFNASVQGTARLGSVMFSKNPKIRKRALMQAAMIFGVGGLFQELMRMLMGRDDDDKYYYDKVNPWTRNHKIVIPNFASDDPKDYFTIPLPYGLNFLWAASGSVGDIIHGNFTPGSAMSLAASGVDAFSPYGAAESNSSSGTVLKTFTPTLARPVMEIALNEDFAGKPIRPENNPFSAYRKPESEMYFNGISPIFKKIAESMNSLSGGDSIHSGKISVSPEYLEYLTNYYGAGVGRFINGVVNTTARAIDPDADIEIGRAPFARVFSGAISNSADKQLYKENIANYEAAEKELKEYRDAGDVYGEHESTMRNKSLLDLKKDYAATHKHISEINKEQRDLDDPRRFKQLEEEKAREMKKFNRSYTHAIEMLK